MSAQTGGLALHADLRVARDQQATVRRLQGQVAELKLAYPGLSLEIDWGLPTPMARLTLADLLSVYEAT